MSAKRRRRSGKRRSTGFGAPGVAPGTLVIDPKAPFPRIRVMAYSPERYAEAEVESVDELRSYLEQWPRVWVNVDGLGDEKVLRSLGSLFGIHRLALEDVVNIGQRPKVEPYEGFLFLIARMAPLERGERSEQLSLVLGPSFVVTFQELQEGDCFDGVRERIRHGQGLIRKAGPDYLTYALLDAVVDAYFPALDRVRERLDALEDEVLENPTSESVNRIHHFKHELLWLRRTVAPHREAINTLLRDSSAFVTDETGIHLRDCYDHVLRVVDLVEVYREQCSNLMSTYLSLVSNRMNEVMKVLTIIATVFIPLSFVAGLYGMNFDPEVSPWNMPELGWRLGYPFALGLMALLAAALLAYIWRKGWFK